MVTYFCSSGSSVCSWTLVPLDKSQTCAPHKCVKYLWTCYQWWIGWSIITGDTPHSADKRTTGSHAHSGRRLLAFLLHSSCFEVQHPPFDVKGGLNCPGITCKHFFYIERGVWFMTILTCKILYLCCYSLQWTTAPWAFLCRLGGVDHKGRSQAIRTVTGWGRASGSQTHKQCGQSHMRPQTGSRQPPPKWGVSIPTNKWHHHNQWPTVEDSSLPIFEFTKFTTFNPHAPP